MQPATPNPFHFLEVTEAAPPDEFVSLFSDYLLRHTTALFEKGNVVIKGIEGSGKSMLLYLFKPEVRIAYNQAHKTFPVPAKLGNFIAAGINFTKTGASEFGQRRLMDSGDDRDIPLLFADYINYRVVGDLLASLTLLDGGLLADRTLLQINARRFDAFARALAEDNCWFGALRHVRTMDDLRSQIDERLHNYRAFMNFNIDSLPEAIVRTKTPIHEPVGQAVEHLWLQEVIPRHTNVFVRFDQFEEVSTSRLESTTPATRELRRILNKAFGARDRRVFYRVGVRRYAWEQDLLMHGTSASLEIERDYHEIDLDELLRRKENPRTWIFPEFAAEVFAARARSAGYEASPKSLALFFGGGLAPDARARHYARKVGPKLIEVDKEWPVAWRSHLEHLSVSEPLEALLGASWIRQQVKRGMPVETADVVGNKWRSRRWWRKERLPQALTQIANRARQRTLWCGAKEVLSLSGGNILIFLNICREVWAAHARARAASGARHIPRVDCNEQTLGIYQVSVTWRDKIESRPGGADRQRFLDWLAGRLHTKLTADKMMSYPGHNGFSIELNDLRLRPEVNRFLELASDFGDLFDYAHTTREKGRSPRRKWYIMPILSPYYQLPLAHTKEPLYVDTQTLREWLAAAGVDEFRRQGGSREALRDSPREQIALFPKT